jgi:hypothetical protein
MKITQSLLDFPACGNCHPSAAARTEHPAATTTDRRSPRLYWENGGRGVISAAAQKTAEISLPVAITVFPDDVYRPPETWARRAYRNLIYFHEVDKGAAEIRAAFKSLRPADRKVAAR